MAAHKLLAATVYADQYNALPTFTTQDGTILLTDIITMKTLSKLIEYTVATKSLGAAIIAGSNLKAPLKRAV